MQKNNRLNVAAVVLAAGKGTRMKSSMPKVLHHLLGKPLVGHVIELLKCLDISRIVTVVGHGAESVTSYLAPFGVETVIQEEQLGTGHAVAVAESVLSDFTGHVLVVCGDTPLFLKDTLSEFLLSHLDSGNVLSVLSSKFDNPFGYGRIVRDASRRFLGIREEKDADEHLRAINEVNTGTYLVQAEFLFSALNGLDNNNAQQEYYLTDIVGIAVSKGQKADAFCLASEQEALGVNSRLQLLQAEGIMLDRIRNDLMAAGVTLQNASTIYVEPSVAIEPDVIVEPCCVLRGNTRVGTGSRVGAHSYLKDAEIAAHTSVPPQSCIQS